MAIKSMTFLKSKPFSPKISRCEFIIELEMSSLKLKIIKQVGTALMKEAPSPIG